MTHEMAYGIFIISLLTCPRGLTVPERGIHDTCVERQRRVCAANDRATNAVAGIRVGSSNTDLECRAPLPSVCCGLCLEQRTPERAFDVSKSSGILTLAIKPGL